MQTILLKLLASRKRLNRHGMLWQSYYICHFLVVKLRRRMRWAWHVVSTGGKRNTFRVFVGKEPLGRPSHRWSIMLKCILRKYGRKMWTWFFWLRMRISGGLFGQGNETRAAWTVGNFLTNRTLSFLRRTLHHAVGWLVFMHVNLRGNIYTEL